MKTLKQAPEPDGERRARAFRLGLWGLLAHWEEVKDEPWLDVLFEYEDRERRRRSLERRVRNARIGRFKPRADFDWSFPQEIDREGIEELFTFDFVREGANAVLLGPNGVGKTTLAKNLAHEGVLGGHTVRFSTASDMLNDLAMQDGPRSLARRLRSYIRPQLLVLDEVGYLSYGSEHADLLFDIVTRRHPDKSTVVTTNKPFSEWNDVFPHSSSVVALVDRLVHKAEIFTIRGESYRLKEAQERSARRKRNRPKASDGGQEA